MELENTNTSHTEMKRLLRENNRLLAANNAILRKQERRAKWALVGRVLWLAIIVGLPLVMYWYLRDSFEVFLSVMQTGQGIEAGVDMEWIQELLETYDFRRQADEVE